MKHRIAILQPEVPHYREEFFQRLAEGCDTMDMYVYNSFEQTKKHGFSIETEGLRHIPNLNVHQILLYSFFPLLSKKYDTLVLMLHFAHLTTWLLLLTTWLHRKRIILWGQGISVKRYLKEEKMPDWKLKMMMAMADGVWIYEEPEAKQWQKIFPKKRIVALNNTLTGAEEMCENAVFDPEKKKALKEKWHITQEVVLIFCARFENNYRRTDLLLETIQRLDAQQYGFIIIGAGKNKPDFSLYPNVHDFGAVYDNTVKRELFAAADIYFQPGWVGLSIVEAMAYGKPVFTFRRSEETLQCVEYCYIDEGKTGLIFDDIDDCLTQIRNLKREAIECMGRKAQALVKEKLTPRQMAANALRVLNEG